MDIVCDTHIWYKLGQNPPTKEFLKKHNLIGTYNSINELSRTFNLVNHEDYTRKAIQSLMKDSKQKIYLSPLQYLKWTDDIKYSVNVVQQYGDILNFTRAIANGEAIKAEKESEYRQYCQNKQDDLQKASDIFNDLAAEIKPRIKDKKKHRAADSKESNRKLISMFVAQMTGTDGLSEDFDWSRIELFEAVFKEFLNDLELGARKAQPNDWFDLFLLMYVTPGRKIWTEETKWVDYINKVGMEKYLFNPEEEETKQENN